MPLASSALLSGACFGTDVDDYALSSSIIPQATPSVQRGDTSWRSSTFSRTSLATISNGRSIASGQAYFVVAFAAQPPDTSYRRALDDDTEIKPAAAVEQIPLIAAGIGQDIFIGSMPL